MKINEIYPENEDEKIIILTKEYIKNNYPNFSEIISIKILKNSIIAKSKFGLLLINKKSLSDKT